MLYRIHSFHWTELFTDLTDYFSDQLREKVDPGVFIQALDEANLVSTVDSSEEKLLKFFGR